MLQEQPQPEPPSQPGPITIDLSGLAGGIWQWFIDHIGDLGDAVGAAAAATLQGVWDGIWNSGANVFGHTDEALLLGGYAAFLRGEGFPVLYGILFLAVVLLCVKSLTQAFTGGGGILQEALGGIGEGVFLLVGYLIYLGLMVSIVNRASDLIGRADLSSLFRGPLGVDPWQLVLMFVLLLFFGMRLLIRSVYRMGMLVLLSGFGVIALPLRALPFAFCKRLSETWVQHFHGWLWGQIPSVAALSVGVQLAVNTGGLGALVYTIAFAQLAYDMYDLVIYGFIPRGSSPFGLAMQLPRMIGGGSGAGAAAGAGAGAGMTNMQHLADQYGY